MNYLDMLRPEVKARLDEVEAMRPTCRCGKPQLMGPPAPPGSTIPWNGTWYCPSCIYKNKGKSETK